MKRLTRSEFIDYYESGFISNVVVNISDKDMFKSITVEFNIKNVGTGYIVKERDNSMLREYKSIDPVNLLFRRVGCSEYKIKLDLLK